MSATAGLRLWTLSGSAPALPLRPVETSAASTDADADRAIRASAASVATHARLPSEASAWRGRRGAVAVALFSSFGRRERLAAGRVAFEGAGLVVAKPWLVWLIG